MRKYIPLSLLYLCGLALLSACSGIKTYPNDHPANMKVVAKTDSGSILQGIDTMVHIYTVSNKCESEYLGTVELDDNKSDVGLPVGQLLYLNFVFVRGGFFSSSTSSTGIDTLLRPKPGAHYLADLQYLDDMYDMEIWERTSGKSGKRKLPIVPFEACKAK
jgi:hypothetical protein